MFKMFFLFMYIQFFLKNFAVCYNSSFPAYYDLLLQIYAHVIAFLCYRPESVFFFYNSFFSNYFVFFAILCCYFSFKCVFSKNIIEVLYSLVCVFLTSSGCLFCINVAFLAIINITVYVGAIVVLFLFSTMLLDFREIVLLDEEISPFFFLFFFFFFFTYF